MKQEHLPKVGYAGWMAAAAPAGYQVTNPFCKTPLFHLVNSNLVNRIEDLIEMKITFEINPTLKNY